MLSGVNPEITVRSLWLREALKNRSLSARLDHLRLERGEFKQLQEDTRHGVQRAPVRCFLATGPRGGLHGVLLAYMDHGYVRIGVFISTKHRRKGLGKRLVAAAQGYYAGRKFKACIWSILSSYFWTSLGHESKIPRNWLGRGLSFTANLTSPVA